MGNRLEREEKTIETMIKLYCGSKHNIKDSPCDGCISLINYAKKRVKTCKFGDKKPICGRCKIHCYKPEMRKQIREVMRSTGYKMIYKHPIMLLYHIYDIIKY